MDPTGHLQPVRLSSGRFLASVAAPELADAAVARLVWRQLGRRGWHLAPWHKQLGQTLNQPPRAALPPRDPTRAKLANEFDQAGDGVEDERQTGLPRRIWQWRRDQLEKKYLSIFKDGNT